MAKFMKNKGTKGITLIALVITIIVLLILAGISISMISGNNSILSRAGNAKENTENASMIEQMQIKVLGCYDESAKPNMEKLKNDLENMGANVIGDKFPVTATISEKKYTIESNGNVQEVNNNVITMAELQKNASKYFGYDVINYAETLPENLQDTKWQLFYAGAIEGEIEQRIYLISKEYVKNTVLPAKDGRRPIAVEGSEYKAMLDRDDKRDGVLIKYTNLLDVSPMKNYIKDYFKDYSDRVSPNTKSTSYMLDTPIWQPFASSTKSYAEWAIGGPTVELLLIAYNKYAGTSYETKVASQRGYQVRKTSTDEFSNGMGNAIDKESLYIAPNITDQDDYYWIASPFNAQANMIYIVSDQGGVGGASYNVSNGSFRPIVLLNSNFQLEKVKDTNNKEVFKIVSK